MSLSREEQNNNNEDYTGLNSLVEVSVSTVCGRFLIRISVPTGLLEYIFGCMKMNHQSFVMFFQTPNSHVGSRSTPHILLELESFFRCTENDNVDKCRKILNVFRALDTIGISTSRIAVFKMTRSQIQDHNKF
jgi:hypothetical protein